MNFDAHGIFDVVGGAYGAGGNGLSEGEGDVSRRTGAAAVADRRDGNAAAEVGVIHHGEVADHGYHTRRDVDKGDGVTGAEGGLDLGGSADGHPVTEHATTRCWRDVLQGADGTARDIGEGALGGGLDGADEAEGDWSVGARRAAIADRADTYTGA